MVNFTSTDSKMCFIDKYNLDEYNYLKFSRVLGSYNKMCKRKVMSYRNNTIVISIVLHVTFLTVVKKK